MINIIKPDLLGNRLDADFYKKDFIENELILSNFGSVTLSNLIDVKKSGYGVLPKSDEYLNNGLPLIRGGDLSFGRIQEIGVFVPEYYKDSRAIAKTGDVLILIKGACIDGPEGVARIGEAENGYLYNGSCYRLSFKQSELDGYFFIAYSQTKFFLKQKKRQIANTGISYNDESSILNYLVPNFSAIVKKYIGDKVRQAELLKKIAKLKHIENATQLSNLIGEYKLENSKYQYVTPEFITERLDQNHYQTSLLSCHALLKEKMHVTLGDKKYFSGLTDGDHGNPVYGEDVFYLRASELRDGIIEKKNLVSIASFHADKVGESCWAREGDIIFSIVGTLGLTAIVTKETEGVMSRGIAKITSCILPKYYVKSFFKTDYFKKQLDRYSVGSVQRGVYLSALNELLVPVLDDTVQRDIASTEKLADQMLKISNKLIRLSSYLVEALIEGVLKEDQLIQAYNAVEQGDTSLDRVILSQMTEDGYAVAGSKPLFSDLDEFYDLLEQAKALE